MHRPRYHLLSCHLPATTVDASPSPVGPSARKSNVRCSIACGRRARVWIATAYFIPPWKIRRALKKAVGRGVDVRLLLPGPVTDHPAVRHAGRRYYQRLLRRRRAYLRVPATFPASESDGVRRLGVARLGQSRSLEPALEPRGQPGGKRRRLARDLRDARG